VSDTRAFREATIRTALGSSDEHRAAFENRGAGVPEPARVVVGKVAADATTVTDDDMHAAAAALGDDRVFELVVCAALGEATRQLDAALAALDEAGIR
jgi:hypothetical protein